MPKQNKSGSKPGAASPLKERPTKFFCMRCERSFDRRKYNFPVSQSPMYKENDGHVHICRHCVDEMFQHYKAVFGDEKMAIRRMCMKLDIYWNPAIYDAVYKANTTSSRIMSYISKSNLVQYKGKTFDDTLDEEAQLGINPTIMGITGENSDGEPIVNEEIIDFWGGGLAPSFYAELERRYKYWCGDTDRNSGELDVGEIAVIKQICMLEATINRDSALGKPIDKLVNSLNTMLGSANLKPIQKKEGVDAAAEATPFGVWIRKIENTRPISEPDPEFRDVDGIIKYVSIWFFGHLCKMLKIPNKYSQLYEEEMARLRVERPEYEGEDDEAVLEDIFERARAAESEDGDLNVE